jgi:hypothetical protein
MSFSLMNPGWPLATACTHRAAAGRARRGNLSYPHNATTENICQLELSQIAEAGYSARLLLLTP